MKKSFYIVILLICVCTRSLLAQTSGINNNWITGYFQGLGQSKLDFYLGSPVITQYNIPMDFNHTHANISDSAGNLLFYTNGVYIADATNDTMMNGSGINPGAYADAFPDGLLIPQGALIIKKPESDSIYYMFHNTLDNHPTPGAYSLHFYLTTIDISLNNGLGGVLNKNQSLLDDSMNTGKIAACKHANGRDWWVVIHQLNTNTFFKFLITPTLIFGPYQQSIGVTRWQDAGQAKFSPDGNKYSYYHYFDGLNIMDFDRCTGMFSNVLSDVTLPYIQGNVGCEFSPNSQVLYVCNITNIYQYDLTASNVLASRTIVAAWDSFTQPGQPNLGAYLCYPQLAPDGKIYITTGNGTTYMGRIDDPDVVGAGCSVAQHSVLLPTYYFNTIPNHPNYFLGCDTTSSCTCLTTGINSPQSHELLQIKSYPNPTTGNLTIQFNVQDAPGELEIYDVLGNCVLKDYISPWSQLKQVDITAFPSGIYFVKMKWKSGEAGVKVVKEGH